MIYHKIMSMNIIKFCYKGHIKSLEDLSLAMSAV